MKRNNQGEDRQNYLSNDSSMPREKLAQYGACHLSDAELLAILLGTGCKGKTVIELAQELLEPIDIFTENTTDLKIRNILGIGNAKNCIIYAALEFGRRKYKPAELKVSHPGDVWLMIKHYADRKQERFITISLNGAHEVIAIRIVSIGTINRTLVHPREVFADIVQDRAAGLIVAHTHPSGRLEPSLEDKDVTKKLYEAGQILGIPVLDHLIISIDGFYSFCEHGEINIK